jgi:hypothetical protein
MCVKQFKHLHTEALDLKEHAEALDVKKGST